MSMAALRVIRPPWSVLVIACIFWVSMIEVGFLEVIEEYLMPVRVVHNAGRHEVGLAGTLGSHLWANVLRGAGHKDTAADQRCCIIEPRPQLITPHPRPHSVCKPKLVLQCRQ